MDFNKSQTKENLMRAFAGESQARNRYNISGNVARKQNLFVVEQIFNFTADQERMHAKIFYDYLKDVSGENIKIDGTYPVDISDDVVKLLRAARHNELQEYEHDYVDFARIAKEEGFSLIYNSFSMISKIEKVHAERFGIFADRIEQDKLFSSDTETEWLCLKCGQVHKGLKAPKSCPVCKHNQGYFVPIELAPYTNILMV